MYVISLARKHIRSAGLYVVFGLSALAMELMVFYILQSKIQLLVANFIAVASGMIISFTLNARVNFKVNGRMGIRFLSYGVTVAIGYLLSSALLYTFTELALHPMIAKLLTLPFVFIFQYTLNVRFAFKQV